MILSWGVAYSLAEMLPRAKAYHSYLMLTAYQRLHTLSPLAYLLLVVNKGWCREICRIERLALPLGTRDLGCAIPLLPSVVWFIAEQHSDVPTAPEEGHQKVHSMVILLYLEALFNSIRSLYWRGVLDIQLCLMQPI